MHCLEIIRKMNNQAVSFQNHSSHFEKRPYEMVYVPTDDNHPLLNIKKILDSMLRETPDLPTVLKQSIILARDNARELFEVDQKRALKTTIKA